LTTRQKWIIIVKLILSSNSTALSGIKVLGAAVGYSHQWLIKEHARVASF
jgi:hypothetical protein